MKKLLFVSIVLALVSSTVNSQGLKGVLNKATKRDSTGKNSIDRMMGKSGSIGLGLSSDDIANGLKEALKVGAEKEQLNYPLPMVFLEMLQ